MRPNEAGRARERRRGPVPKPYRVVLRGELSERFAAEFEGMALTRGEGRTYLNGRIDQSQLHGILERAWHYNLEIIEVAEALADRRKNAARRDSLPREWACRDRLGRIRTGRHGRGTPDRVLYDTEARLQTSFEIGGRIWHAD